MAHLVSVDCRTQAEWDAQTRPVSKLRLAYNTTTGELRKGPGYWADMLPIGLRANTEVVAATTANITVATALNNGDVLDGVTLATGDLVLVKNQSSASANGIYVVGASPARAAAYDTFAEHVQKSIRVLGGTVNKNRIYACSSPAGGTLDSTAINFELAPTGALQLNSADIVDSLPKRTSTISDTAMVLVYDPTSKQLVTLTLTDLAAALA